MVGSFPRRRLGHIETPLVEETDMTRIANMAREAMEHGDHREGRIARAIEDQTAKLPSDTFLWAALGAIAVSASLQFMGNRQVSNFVGQWAPTFLILGLYNKMVKQLGSDRTENAI
jgi:hypothetical protein